jgi:medium-chain acyl-[acyl-carrier-protein] hydrolase
MESHKFEKEYSIHVYETGPNGKLSLYSLFNYMQDIASDHAIKLGFGRDDLLRDNCFWVLSRMYSEIEIWPQWEENIIVTTWPNGTDKLFALRNYEISYADGRHIASGTSSWLILDKTTKKIQRPESILSKYNRDLQPKSSPVRYALKLEAVKAEGEQSQPFRVKVSDLDLNLHTNNVRYLNWVYDTYNIDFVSSNNPQSVEINYLAESVFNEEIVINTSSERGTVGLYDHTVSRTSDNKELCRIRIVWQNINLINVN